MNRARKTWGRQPWPPALCLALGAAGLFTGCGGAGNTMTETSSIPSTPPAFTGVMESGTNPVRGAAISFYAAGSSGPAAGATNLLQSQTVTTDASGKFSIPSFQCPGNATQVYLVGRGGDTATGGDNQVIVMMAALGDCGSITASTAVVMNEVTTAAAAWALARFIGADAVITASATNATGLRNAFLTAANLADTTKGTAPGPGLPANTKLETAKLNSLATALWGCNQLVSNTACSNLFSAATVANSAPVNTLDAALSVVRNPGANPAAVFANAAQSPFAPVLGGAPHDWTLSATFGNCSSGCGALNLPGALAIDSTGNVWVANYFGGAASKFSNTGTPASPGGYTATSLQGSFGIAVDGQDSPWITSNTNSTNSLGSVTHLSSSGTNLSGAGYSGGGIYYPMAVAATTGGNIWVADYANAAATLLASDGTAISGSSGYAPNVLLSTTAVAIDGNQNGWFAYLGGVAMITQKGVVSSYSCCYVPGGIALDASGNVWVADYLASDVVKLSSSGSVVGQTAAGSTYTPTNIAVDGSGNVWTANYHANTVSEISGATLQAISPAAGLGLDAALSLPFGLGFDASGNVWISNAHGNTLTELIGAAGPVKTPVLGLPAQP